MTRGSARRTGRPARECLLLTPPDRISRYPYLGVVSLAGALRERGIDVEVLDCTVSRLSSVEGVVDEVVRRRPRILGLSAPSTTLAFAYQLIQGVRSECPDTTLVLGGAHINVDPRIVDAIGADYGLVGECEETLGALCCAVLGREEPGPIIGLVRRGAEGLAPVGAAIVADLDALPFPAYDLLPLDRYYSPNADGRTLSMVASRGCPYACSFCSKRARTPVRWLSIARIIAQLSYLTGPLGARWVEMVDETFTLDRPRIMALCRGIREAGLRMAWGAQTRIELLDPELLDAMASAGCRKLAFGIESGVQRIRARTGKGFSDEDIHRVVALCRRHHVQTTAHYILGHPAETAAEMLATVRFARRARTDLALFSRMLPLPGSGVFRRAVAEGVLPATAWTDFMVGRKPLPFYTPPRVDRAVVEWLLRWAWLRWYTTPHALGRNAHVVLRPRQLLRHLRSLALQISSGGEGPAAHSAGKPVRGLSTMIRNRQGRQRVYTKPWFWDAKVTQYAGTAATMWPNVHLNRRIHEEQILLLERCLGDLRGRRVLDVGCATGRIARHLAARGAEVVGIDFSRESLAAAAAASAPGAVSYRLQSLLDLDEVDAYSAILSMGVLCVACRECRALEDALYRFHRALQGGGLLVIIEPFHRGWLHRVLELSVSEVIARLDAAGFDIEEVAPLYAWPARLLLSHLPWPEGFTRAVFDVGEWALRHAPRQGSFGDYCFILARARGSRAPVRSWGSDGRGGS